jgi:hypothetical protein
LLHEKWSFYKGIRELALAALAQVIRHADTCDVLVYPDCVRFFIPVANRVHWQGTSDPPEHLRQKTRQKV